MTERGSGDGAGGRTTCQQRLVWQERTAAGRSEGVAQGEGEGAGSRASMSKLSDSEVDARQSHNELEAEGCLVDQPLSSRLTVPAGGE